MKTPTPTLKSIKVTNTRHRFHSNGDRYIADGCNVYTESNLSELVDKFFSENDIRSLNFKSKTWTKLKNLVKKIEGAELRKHLGVNDEATVAFSHTTGCSCGCSPGFRVRKMTTANYALRNCDAWVKLTFDVKPLKAELPKFKEMLIAEIQSH